MTREQEIASSVDRLCRFLGRSARKVKIETLRRKGEIKAKLPFGVDGCIKIDRRYLLVQILDVSTIPDRIIRAKACLGANTSIIILACASADAEAVDIASEIADDAMENGLGLAFESSDEVYGVFPPGFAAVAPTTDPTAFGHIPHWLVAAVEAASGFSTYFHDCIVPYAEDYRARTR